MQAQTSARNFPVVCVGGSAGGLDAYIRLLRHLPPDMGVAIVIVNHLRVVATHLHEILPGYTEMPVELIVDGLRLQPNHVFIIPARHDLHVRAGEFVLMPISKPRGWSNVITVFLRSLTRNWEGKLIAVIVSGYDGDGAAALCGIREVGGITIAQRPDTAVQPDMPGSAIASGCIDFVLSPEDIARKIMRVAYGGDIPGAGARVSQEDIMAKPTRKQKAIVEHAMHAFKHGGLESSDGGTVTDRKQAIAIALSEVDRAKPDTGAPVTRKRKGNLITPLPQPPNIRHKP